MRHEDATRLTRIVQEKFDFASYAGRFLTDALIIEVREVVEELCMEWGTSSVPRVIIERDLIVSVEPTPAAAIEAAKRDGRPVPGPESLRVAFKDDSLCRRVKLSLPAMPGFVVLMILDITWQLQERLDNVRNQREAIAKAVHLWACETDEGSLFYANHSRPTILDIAHTEFCQQSNLVPLSLLHYLRKQGIMEMWLSHETCQWEATAAIELPPSQKASSN